MEGELWLGAPTDDDLQRGRRALDTARAAWDADAMACSAARPDLDGSGEPRTVPVGEWDRLLEEVVGKPDVDLWFVELTHDRIGLIRVSADDNGLPRAVDAGGASWSSVAPRLAREDEARAFQLAGGIGSLPPVDRRAFDRGVRQALESLLPAGERDRTVLLAERPDWSLIGRATAVVRSLRTPAVEIGPARAGLRVCGA